MRSPSHEPAWVDVTPGKPLAGISISVSISICRFMFPGQFKKEQAAWEEAWRRVAAVRSVTLMHYWVASSEQKKNRLVADRGEAVREACWVGRLDYFLTGNGRVADCSPALVARK